MATENVWFVVSLIRPTRETTEPFHGLSNKIYTTPGRPAEKSRQRRSIAFVLFDIFVDGFPFFTDFGFVVVNI